MKKLTKSQLRLNRSQKGNTVAILLVVIVLVVLAFWWLMKSGYKLPGQTAQVPSSYQNISDLDAAARDLDNVNLNQMDPGISQISSDASSF